MGSFHNKLKSLIRWAFVTKKGNSGQQFYTQQVSYKGKVSDCLIVLPYGLHANLPEKESFVLLFSVEGDPENRAGIGWDPKNRPNLAEGEVALYQPRTNTIIKFAKDGSITVKSDVSVTVDSPNTIVTGNVTINGNAQVDGNLTVNGNTSLGSTVTSNGKNISDDHMHSGVTAGPANTGPPV